MILLNENSETNVSVVTYKLYFTEKTVKHFVGLDTDLNKIRGVPISEAIFTGFKQDLDLLAVCYFFVENV